VLGVVAGFLAVLDTLAPPNRPGRWPAEVRAERIGAAVGVLARFLPRLVGGGQEVAQRTLILAPSSACPSASCVG
jgi:CIC family chloride channel protein